jgi:hypothetical protein
LQQSLTLRIGTVNITLDTGSSGGQKYGRKSIDSLSRNEHKDWKNDRKSFDFSRTAKKDIPISNNS